ALDVPIGKDSYIVDRAKSGDKLRAGLLIENRTTRTFQAADAVIGIYADNENIALLFCALEVTNMADMKRIKTAVGEGNALAFCLGIGNAGVEMLERENFGRGRTHVSGVLRCGFVNGFGKFVARDGGSTALHDDQTACDIGKVGSFERRCAGSERKGVGGEDGVACAGDVDGLIAAVYGNEGRRFVGLK